MVTASNYYLLHTYQHTTMSIKRIDYKITTITMSCKLPLPNAECTLNLTNIGKFLELDDVIVGLKMAYGDTQIMKGEYCTTIYRKAKHKDSSKINTQLFFNQITLLVNHNGNDVNVKLFGNGSLHLTGCKSVSEGPTITQLVYTRLLRLVNQTHTVIVSKDPYGALLDKDNMVYSSRDNTIIGYTKNNRYYIENKEYSIDKKTGLFVSNNDQQRTRTLLDLDGHCIGHLQIKLVRNKTKLYKKNTSLYYDWDNLLLYNNDTVIGTIEYLVKQPVFTACSDVLEIEYKCNPFQLVSGTLDPHPAQIQYDVNSINICFNIGFKLNRQKLYEQLIQHRFICKYRPESYSGIKLVYKLDIDNVYDGICTCSNKCTCTNITFLIFQSGNIITTGFKDPDSIDDVVKAVVSRCMEWKDCIQNKQFM